MKQISLLIFLFGFSTAHAKIQITGSTCTSTMVLEEIKSRKTDDIKAEYIIAQRTWKTAQNVYGLTYIFNSEVKGIDLAPVLGSRIEKIKNLEDGSEFRNTLSRMIFVNKGGKVLEDSRPADESIEETDGLTESSTWSVKDGRKFELLSRTSIEDLEGERRRSITKTVKLGADTEVRTLSNELECFSRRLSQEDFEALAHDSKISKDLAELDRLFLKFELDGKPESLAAFEKSWNEIYNSRKKRLEKTYADAVEKNRRARIRRQSIRSPYERTPAEQAASCAIWNQKTLGLVPTPSCPGSGRTFKEAFEQSRP